MITSSIENANPSDKMSCRRRCLYISIKNENCQVLFWMMQEVEKCGPDEQIAEKALNYPPFSQIFHSNDERSRKSNCMKVSRW